MKAFGRKTKSMDLEGSLIQKETFTKVNGLMEFHMAKANVSIPTDLLTKGTGEIINHTGLGLKSTKMVLRLEETLLWG